jgi:ketopantoate reductase
VRIAVLGSGGIGGYYAGVGGVTALARSGIGPLLASPGGRTLLTTSCEEIAAVALAERVPLPAGAVDRAVKQAVTLPPQWRSSEADVQHAVQATLATGTVLTLDGGIMAQ